jgi:hypothetical protein
MEGSGSGSVQIITDPDPVQIITDPDPGSPKTCVTYTWKRRRVESSSCVSMWTGMAASSHTYFLPAHTPNYKTKNIEQKLGIFQIQYYAFNLCTREYWLIYRQCIEDLAFSPSYGLFFLSLPMRVAGKAYWRVRGGEGWARSQIIRRREKLVL